MNLLLALSIFVFVVVVFSTIVLLKSWMNFVDKQNKRKFKSKKREEFEIINYVSDFSRKKNLKETIIDVECEIINENTDIVRYLQ
tara:strand:- start:2657 stop:2911 length:255 start_codon:yes stop_codon:yes gene_type:complete